MKNKILLYTFILITGIILCMLLLKWDAIFQEGNPLPYLLAASKLSEERTYAKVPGKENLYISKRGEYSQLFAFLQETRNAALIDQLGSGYLFSDGTEDFLVLSEIYWGNYTIWTLPASGFPLDKAYIP